MPLFQPQELRRFLEEHGLYAKKSLSQSFLIDGNIVKKIIHAASLDADDLVIEIGPGPGTLTEALLEANTRVMAIEKDDALAPLLSRLDPGKERLEVIQGDALTFPYEEEMPRRLGAGKKAKVVANLPYQVATALITHLLPMRELLSCLVVMVQEEVAQRLTASAGGKEYGSLSLFTRFYSRPHYAFPVRSTCFYPQPKVQSAVVRFDLSPPPADTDEEAFFLVVRKAFNYRRKMLRTSLQALYEKDHLERAFMISGIAAEARPESLTLDDFLRLVTALGHP